MLLLKGHHDLLSRTGRNQTKPNGVRCAETDHLDNTPLHLTGPSSPGREWPVRDHGESTMEVSPADGTAFSMKRSSLSPHGGLNGQPLKLKRRKIEVAENGDIAENAERSDSLLTDDDWIEKNEIPPEVIYRLKDFSLFSDAPNDFFIALARVLRLVQYNPQEYIVKHGEPAKSMYWILRGTVGVTSTDGESVYAELAAGSFFGEIGILFNCPRTATVVARTKVLLGVLTKDSLTKVLSDYPHIEQIIRDEAQERLLMQEKKKSLVKMSLPAISRKVSIFAQSGSNYPISDLPPTQSNDGLNKMINTSQVANDHDQVPGPSLPPISTLFNLVENQNVTSLGTSVFPDSEVNSVAVDCSATDVTKRYDMQKRRATLTSIGNIDNTISIRDFLYSLKPFASLPRNIIHELALDVELLRYRPMEHIFKKGDFGRDIYFIVYGEVEVIDEGKVLARLTSMMYFGAFAFLSTFNGKPLKPRSADIRTISDCEILMIKASSLDSICEKYPIVSEEFKKNSTEMLQLHERAIDHQKSESNIFKNFSFGSSQIPPSMNETSPVNVDPIHLPKASKIKNDAKLQTSPAPMFKSFSFNTANLNHERSKSDILTMPPLNPIKGSIQSFSNFQKRNFQYAPLEFRRRLSSINMGRRRSSVLNIGPFPDSIFLKIFQILDLKTLMKCAGVCMRWKQLIYLSSSLFKRLDLTPFCKEIDDNSLVQITKLVGSRPQYINISNCYHVTDEGFCFLINEVGMRGNVKELIMRNNWNISAMAIMDLSIACKSLIKLDLSNCRKVKDDVMMKLIGTRGDHASGCHYLQDLSLGYCKYLTDKTMNHIISNTEDILVGLDLTRCTTITDNGFMNFSNHTFQRLKKLILRDCTFLSDRVIEKVSMSCPSLETLDLTFCCMLTDYSLKLLSYGCPKLVDLNLSFCGAAVSDYSLNDLKSLVHLKYLSIKGCVRVTREGVDFVLTEIKNLKEFNILQCSRVNIFRGVQVEPFDKSGGGQFSCLKIKPHGRIVKVRV